MGTRASRRRGACQCVLWPPRIEGSRRLAVLVVFTGALLLAFGVAGAQASVYVASPPVTTSFGAVDPFVGCTADNVSGQEAAFGSTLYPAAEPEPRADINPIDTLNIAGAFHEDRWSDGGDRGLASSASHDGGKTWTQAVVPGITKCSGGQFDRASDPWVSFARDGTL